MHMCNKNAKPGERGRLCKSHTLSPVAGDARTSCARTPGAGMCTGASAGWSLVGTLVLARAHAHAHARPASQTSRLQHFFPYCTELLLQPHGSRLGHSRSPLRRCRSLLRLADLRLRLAPRRLSTSPCCTLLDLTTHALFQLAQPLIRRVLCLDL